MLKKRIFIGRNEENDIVVPAVFNVVSGSHADLKLLDSGEYLYSDHSTNGSTVKGKKIRNESMTVAFGTPIILATRYALDWERVRELLPPPTDAPAPNDAPQAPNDAPPASAPTQIRGMQSASDWHPSHPADFTPNIPKVPQPVYDRSSHIDPVEMQQSSDPRETRRSNDPRATRLSNDPRETRLSDDPRATRLSDDQASGPADNEGAGQDLGLNPGDLFDGRFLLVRKIGAGASATVWEAQDTKTDGLKVAIKIFSLKHGMDSYGFQNLQREFTTVFNFTQQYLLTPSFYDVCEGCPYLVMRYCELGSASKLIGNATEPQVIKLLHDVASGLEYLHEKKIIHQDIKPDNILLADNGDFMITDFGISATIDALNGDTGMSGGTRAYMGPERFNGRNESSSDVWSLGATAYELVTGDAPYGDHGGMMQAYGTAVSPIAQKLQPEVKDIIMRCLEKDPAKRPTAAEIRKKIDIYYETGGSWTRRNKAKTVLIIAAVAVLLLGLGAGAWIWDYNRVKTYYYAAVTEVYGVPQGVGKEVKHDKRNTSFMIQKKRGKVIRMANVNSAGKVVTYTDTESNLRYFPDTYYDYGEDGTLKLKKIYNEHGRPMFSMVMDIRKDQGTGSGAFARFYDQNTPMLLPADINQSFKDGNFYTHYSAIYKYDYEFDSDGRVKKVRYKSFDTRPAVDQYGIGGIKYEYDDRGLIVRQQYIDAKDNPTFDNNGLSIKEFEYDDAGNSTGFRMLNIKKGPSHDGNHCPVVKHEVDKYGNMVKESYFDLKGKPAIRTDVGYASLEIDYDEHGHRVEERQYDKKGKLIENKAGWAIVKNEYNDDGFVKNISYFDAKGKPIKSHGDVSSVIAFEVGPTGEMLEMRRFNEKGKPFEDTDGVHLIKLTYDDDLNLQSFSYFDKNDKPINLKGLYHKQERDYDINGNCISVAHYDRKGARATQDGIISYYRMDYNPWGAVVAIRYYNTKNAPTRDGNLAASVKYEYSPETGNQTKETHYDRDGKTLTMVVDGDNNYAICEYEYNNIGQLNTLIYKDQKGKTLRTLHLEKDGRGNNTKRYVMVNGKLDGVVECNNYDENNNLKEIWYTNLNNQPVTGPNGFHKAKMKYDEMGNRTESTFWGTGGQRVTDNTGIHRNVYVYDRFGQTIETVVCDASGRPVNGITSLKSIYDENGNEIEMAWYDKNGHLAVPTGFSWAKRKVTYNDHGRQEKAEFFDKQGRPVEAGGVTKYEYVYNDKGELIKQKEYGRNGLKSIQVTKYNPQGKIKEYYVTDASNRLIQDGKMEFLYESDGVTPTRFIVYDRSNRKLGYILWDDNKKEWDSEHPHLY